MPTRIHLAVTVSIIAHLSILFLIWYRHYSPPEKIELEIQYKQSAKVHARQLGSRHGRTRRKRGLQWSGFSPIPSGKQFTPGNLTQDEGRGLQDEDWGARGGLLSELEHFSKYTRLFEEIEGLLNFPGQLGEHGIGGTVNSRLIFDENSHCDWHKSKISGAHPFLRFYTLALLRKLCALQNIEHLKFAKNQSVDLSFAFAIVRMPESQRDQESRDCIQGNVLSFYRSYRHSDLEYKMGPLRGYWFAPVVYLNFPWIYEHWDSWVEGKDPMRDFKDK